jgi:DNA replication protein DnaC
MSTPNAASGAVDPRAARCPDHPSETAAHCSPCRSELIATLDHPDRDGFGDTELGAAERAAAASERARRAAANKWHALADPEFAGATMADVDDLVTDDMDVIRAWPQLWADDVNPMPWLSILGPVGVGKTHLAHALAREAVTGPRPSECLVVTAPEMYQSLRPGAATPEVRMFQYQNTPLLVIDELGVVKHTDWVEEKTHEILNYRYRRGLPVIFTTNLDVDALKVAIGARMVSRLRQRCLRVVLEGEDRRRPPTLEGLAAATAAALEASSR